MSIRIVLSLLLLCASIEMPAQTLGRLVSTDAGTTELLIALGLADRLAAVDDSSPLPDGLQLPRLGYHRALAAEGLVALAPDLVIGSTLMGPPHVLDALARSGITVLQLPPPLTLAALRENAQRLEQALSGVDAAPIRRRLDAAVDTLKPDSRGAVSTAAFLLRAEGGKLRMAGHGTAGAAFVALLGASNLATHEGYRSLSPEALLALQPDLLLFADTGGGSPDSLLTTLPLLRFSKAHSAGLLFQVDAATLVSGLSLAAVDEALRVRRALGNVP